MLMLMLMLISTHAIDVAGHYCTEGSPSRTQFVCGNSSVYCPRGSAEPTVVLPGFYGVFSGPDAGEQRFWDTGNTTFSLEIPCEPGYYCTGGIKYPCPPGACSFRIAFTVATLINNKQYHL